MTRRLALIFFILLMDVIGISVLYPVTAYLVRRHGGDAQMVTLLTAAYAAAQFVAAPVLGALGDRFGRRPVLLVSVTGSAVGYVIFGVGGALWVLFLSRLIDGVTAGNQSTAAAYIADVSAPGERAKNFTLIGMAWGIGLVCGPAAGAVLGQLNLVAPAYVAAALCALSAILGFCFLPESLPVERRERRPLRLSNLNPFVAIGRMVRRPGLGWPLLALCLFHAAFQGISSTEGLYLIQRFDAQPWHLGLLLVLVGAWVASGQPLLVRRAVPRFGEWRVATVSLLGLALGALVTYSTPALWLIFPVVVLRSAASGFVFPTLGALSANRVPSHAQGVLMGVTTSLGSLMSVVGPLCAGVAYERLTPGAPYWLSAAVLILAALCVVRAGLPTSLTRPGPTAGWLCP